MSRVAANYPASRYNNGVGQSTTSFVSRSSSNASSTNGGGRDVTVRSAAPPPAQKETLHACPLCNGEYKDPRVLPCTHTYCLNCIREKLISNNRVTCPKCHHQVTPFGEEELSDLPRNIILSQEWRLNARPIVSVLPPKKPLVSQPVVPPAPTQMPNQQNRRKSNAAENNNQETTSHATGSHGLAGLMNVFHRSSVSGGGRSSRSSSVSGPQQNVSNLTKIYSEATGSQEQLHQQPSKSRNNSVMSTGKHDELVKIFEQVTNRSQQQQTPPSSSAAVPMTKRPSRAREEAYEEITWDSLVHGTAAAPPSFPDQLQKATENHHHPPEAPVRPISATSSNQHSTTDNLHHIIDSIQQHSNTNASSAYPQGPIIDSQLHSRPSTASRSQNDSDKTDPYRTPTQQTIYTAVQPRQQSRLSNSSDSIRSGRSSSSSSSSSISRQSPVPLVKNTYEQRSSVVSTPQRSSVTPIQQQPSVASTPQRSSVAPIQQQPSVASTTQRSSVTPVQQQPSVASTPQRSSMTPVQQQPSVASTTQRSSVTPVQQQQQQQDDKMSYRTASAASSSKQSSGRFPPPPLNIETLDFVGDRANKSRSISSLSTRSSAYGDAHDQITTNQTNLLSTDRFNPDVDVPPPIHTQNSSRAHSQIGSGASTPVNRSTSASVDRDSHYLAPTSSTLSPSVTTAVTSRVDLLLSDQKHLEHEIEEQIQRLKYDYEDVRKQINRKESSIHHEVKNIASHLDEDVTKHYHRQQKIYTDLAEDAHTLKTELERLKSHTTSNSNNKQQLWANLEQIELSLRHIRQAVQQQKESQGAFTFAEGRRALGADTIGQITYPQTESHRRHQSPQPPPPVASSYLTEQTSTNITPYKYIKIDHLSALEPEAIAITENNKKILLGICNKLFILNEHGETLKIMQLAPSIRGIAVSKKRELQNIAYISHGDTVSMIDIDSGQSLDSVKETDSSGESGSFLPLGIDTDNIHGDVYVCDYRNSCVIKFDEKLEFINQWRIFNHSDQYDEARPKLISVYGGKIYMIVEHSCKPYYNQGIAYTFSLHICDANSGNIIKIVDADLLATQRLRWPCSVQALSNDKCYILDTMTAGKYFNGQWQKHWSRVLEIRQENNNVVTELFQLDSEAATMAMTKQVMVIAANGDILFVDLAFLNQQKNGSEHEYQNLP